jgi:hypothetical protein
MLYFNCFLLIPCYNCVVATDRCDFTIHLYPLVWCSLVCYCSPPNVLVYVFVLDVLLFGSIGTVCMFFFCAWYHGTLCIVAVAMAVYIAWPLCCVVTSSTVWCFEVLYQVIQQGQFWTVCLVALFILSCYWSSKLTTLLWSNFYVWFVEI